MANFCIPKNMVQKLKDSALKGDVDVAALYEMSSKERRAFFEKHTDKELAKLINVEFEKAMISKQQEAMLTWAKSVFTPTARSKPAFKNMVDKINSLDKLGVLDPKSEQAFLEDLVADKLGVSISADEVKQISEKAKKIDEAQEKLGADLGDIATAYDDNLAFFKAKKEMDNYLEGLNPAPALRVATGTFGRGMMLFSLKSPILNIGSNTELAITEALSRRLAGMSYKGTDNKLAREYVKNVNRIYQETGYDISRMQSLADTGASGTRVLGDDRVHTQGKGAGRKAARVVEDIVFKQLMGAPDVAFASAHFADSVNLQALKMANGNKALAREIMVDSMRLNPQTAKGEQVRSQAILDAQTATWTNKTWATKVSEGIRKILNDVTGDVRAGDFLFPFVKTPANVIATGMDYGGLGGLKALGKTIQAIRSGQFGTKEHMQSISRDLVRSGIGLTAALILAAQFDDDDFVGAYDPARAQIEALRNSNENSIRIGDKWISLDWFGPLAIPFTAIMYAKKYGDTPGEQAFWYAQGIGSSIMELPGIKDASDYARTELFNKNQSLDEMTAEAKDYWTKQIYSRLTPSFISDLARATDTVERKTGKELEGIKTKVPGLRQTAPAKENIFGEEIKTEPAWSVLLFGTRVKTDKEDSITKEIVRVQDATDKNVSFTDWEKSSSATIGQFRQFIGDKFDTARKEYGKQIKSNLSTLLNSDDYKKMTDEEKLNKIRSADAEAQKTIFNKYNFKYKK